VAVCVVRLSGLWLFSRKPVDPANTSVMREQAKKLGYDLSVLKKVEQQGCTYPAISGSSSSSNSGAKKPDGKNERSNSGSSSQSG